MNATPLISAIRVKGLFGRYAYNLPQRGLFSDATILYGDNGVGKSTLLRLVFHLLSPADVRGHRTALLRSKFESLEVDLPRKTTISAERAVDGSSLQLKIKRGRATVAEWSFCPEAEDHGPVVGSALLAQLSRMGAAAQRRTPRSQRCWPTPQFGDGASFLKELSGIAPAVFIIDSDRRLDSDAIPDARDELELRRVMRLEETKTVSDLAARCREIALSQALDTANRWVIGHAVESTNRGSSSVHTVYSAVLKQLMTPTKKGRVDSEFATLKKRLGDIECQTADLSRFGLATPLAMDPFIEALSGPTRSGRILSANLLEPYISSLESRLGELQPLFALLDRFINILNSLLRDKSVFFNMSDGFTIRNAECQRLRPAHLSSGEQQLLLLFCNVLTRRDTPSLFMIDEPELSLNVKWQRRLVQALLDVTRGANIQFILASHSIELLAQHRDRVVTLGKDA